MEGPFDHEGPYPYMDNRGYEIDVGMLLYSRRPGVHSKEYTQFDTIRKLIYIYGNQVRAAPSANINHLVITCDKGKYT